MASKKFKNQVCVYCAEQTSSTADHVVARNFFPANLRDGLPKAPSCRVCNVAKANLEHYLTAVLPFGSSHPTALKAQMELVRRRLAKNPRLKRELRKDLKPIQILSPEGSMGYGLVLPFNGDKLNCLGCFIVRGLIWYECRHVVPRDYVVEAFALERDVYGAFQRTILQLGGGKRITRTLAQGGFQYSFAHNSKDPGLSTWTLEFYGGLQIGGPERNGEILPMRLLGMSVPPQLGSTVRQTFRDRN